MGRVGKRLARRGKAHAVEGGNVSGGYGRGREERRGGGGERTAGAEDEDKHEGEDVQGGVVVAMAALGSAGGLLRRFLSAAELGEEEGGWD